MKKLLLLTLSIFAFALTGKTQKPHVVNSYGSHAVTSNNNDTVNVTYLQCRNGFVNITFDKQDTYNSNYSGSIEKGLQWIRLNIDTNQQNSSYEISTPTHGIVAHVNIQLSIDQKDLSIYLDENEKLVNDTLLICNNFDHSYFGITNKLRSFNCNSEIGVFVNNETEPRIKSKYLYDLPLSELNLVDGDSFYFQTTNDTLTCSCLPEITDKVISTIYHVKGTQRNISNITQVLEGSTTICPGEFTKLKIDEGFTPEYSWYEINKDSIILSNGIITVDRPGKYIALKNEEVECPSISNPIEVVKGKNCTSCLISGRVISCDQNNFKEGVGEVNLKTETGLVTVSDTEGLFRFVTTEELKHDRVSITDFNYITQYGYPNYLDTNFCASHVLICAFPLEDNDLAVYLYSGTNRPGFTTKYYVTIKNNGKNELTTDLKVLLDNNLTFIAAQNNPPQVSGQELSWTNLSIERESTIRLTFEAKLDRLTSLGTILSNTAELLLSPEDDILENNVDTFKTIVRGSYDPNDKSVQFYGASKNEFVHDTTQFEYTIRFQNTGTDTAFTVRLEDVISKYLDLSSIETLDASHPYKMTLKDSIVNWVFDDILLPDSTTNEKESHGFVRFRINQVKTNHQNTVIKNKASIFFDFNDPIITNETINIVNNGSITGLIKTNKTTSNEVIVFPNPATDYIQVEGYSGQIRFVNQLGQEFFITGNETFNISHLDQGIYTLIYEQNGQVFSSKQLIK